jgi:RNA-directed DNA polymerase
LPPDKTWLIEFGRHAAGRRAAQGSGKARNVRFPRLHAPVRKVKRAVLVETHHDLQADAGTACRGQRPAHATPTSAHPGAGRGYAAWYKDTSPPTPCPATPTRWRPSGPQTTRHWYTALQRRSQRTRLTWDRMNRLANRWLPPARVKHPSPDTRLDARTHDRSPVREQRTLGSAAIVRVTPGAMSRIA